MKVSIVYATVEGQTRRLAERIAARATAAGHEVEMTDATGPRAALARAGAAILLAPVHAGRYPASIALLARSEAERLSAIPSAFVSVSLNITGDDGERREAEGYPGPLFEATGWHPREVHHAAGALRFSEYDFFKRWVMRLIAARRGQGSGEGDREFTDWAALDAFADEFLADAAARA